MNRLIQNRDLYGLSLSLVMLVLVLYQKMISPTTGIFLLIFLGELFFTRKLKFRLSWPLLAIATLFILYGLALYGSDHLNEGLKIMEYKMTLLIFPFVFSFRKAATNMWDVLQSFIMACVIFSLTCVVGVGLFGVSVFTFSQDIFDIHPTYSSLYLVVASGLLVYGHFRGKFIINKWLMWLGVMCMFTVVVMMLSFSALLLLFVIFGALICRYIYLRFGWIASAAFVVISPLLVFFVISRTSLFSYDYDSMKEVYVEAAENPDWFLERNYDAKSGTKLRILVWVCSYEVIKENPLGVGLGDIDYALYEKFKKYNFTYLLENPLNPHSQYLNVAIDLGLPGLAYFIFLLVYLMIFAWKHKKFVLFYVVFCVAFSCLFESILQRQSGVIFFALFTSVAAVLGENPQKKELKTTT